MNLLTVEQAATKAGISTRGILSAIDRGRLLAHKFAKVWAIESADLERWMNDSANHKHGPKKRNKTGTFRTIA